MDSGGGEHAHYLAIMWVRSDAAAVAETAVCKSLSTARVGRSQQQLVK